MQKVLANTEKPTMNHKEYKVLMDTPAFTVTHDGTLRSKVTISAGRIAKVDMDFFITKNGKVLYHLVSLAYPNVFIQIGKNVAELIGGNTDFSNDIGHLHKKHKKHHRLTDKLGLGMTSRVNHIEGIGFNQ
jgi:hypothetical protein